MSSANVYTASFQTSALSTVGGHDLVGLLSTSQSRVRILAVELWRLSTAGAAAAEGLAVSLWRGSTAAFGGSAITPVTIKEGYGSLGSTAKSAITGNSSSVVSTTPAERLHLGAFNADGTYCYRPPHCDAPIIENGSSAGSTVGQRFHVSVATPQSTALYAIAGTLTWEEFGRIPGL